MPYLFAENAGFEQATKALNQLYRQVQRGQAAPVYLIFGEDEFQVRQVTKRLVSLLMPAGEAGLSLVTFEESQATPQEVLDALQTHGFGSLWGGRRVVVVKDPPFLKPEEGEPAEPDASPKHPNIQTPKHPNIQTPKHLPLLTALSAGLPEGTVAVFSVTKALPSSHPFVRAVERSGVVIPLSKVGMRELPAFVRATCRRLKVAIDEAAAGELIERVGGDLRQLTEELEKLAAYAGERARIELDDVRELVPSLSGDIFRLVDAVAEGNAEKALRLLQTLLQRREHEMRILGMLTRQFRLLLQARLLLDERFLSPNVAQMRTDAIPDFVRRRVPDEVAQRLPENPRLNLLKQSPYVVRLAVRQAQQFDADSLSKALERILQTDVALKTTGQEPALLLELLIADLCQLAA